MSTIGELLRREKRPPPAPASRGTTVGEMLRGTPATPSPPPVPGAELDSPSPQPVVPPPLGEFATSFGTEPDIEKWRADPSSLPRAGGGGAPDLAYIAMQKAQKAATALTSEERARGVHELARYPKGRFLAHAATQMTPEGRGAFHGGIGLLQRELTGAGLEGPMLRARWDIAKFRKEHGLADEPGEIPLPPSIQSPEAMLEFAMRGMSEEQKREAGPFIEHYIRSALTEIPERRKQDVPDMVFENPQLYRKWLETPALRDWWKENIEGLTPEEQQEIMPDLEQYMGAVVADKFDYRNRRLLEKEIPGFWGTAGRTLRRGTLDLLGMALKGGTRTARSILKDINIETGQARKWGSYELGELASQAAQARGLQTEEITGIGDLLTSPTKLFGRVVETIPFMATVAAAMASGGVGAGVVVSYLVEGQHGYENAKRRGASNEAAELEGAIIGAANAAIEVLQIRQAMQFTRAGKQFIQRQLVREMRKQAAGGVKDMTMRTLMLMSREGMEEVAQSFVTHGVPAALGRTDFDWEAFLKEAPEEFVVASIAYMLPAIGGYGVGVATGGRAQQAAPEMGRPTEFMELYKELGGVGGEAQPMIQEPGAFYQWPELTGGNVGGVVPMGETQAGMPGTATVGEMVRAEAAKAEPEAKPAPAVVEPKPAPVVEMKPIVEPKPIKEKPVVVSMPEKFAVNPSAVKAYKEARRLALAGKHRQEASVEPPEITQKGALIKEAWLQGLEDGKQQRFDEFKARRVVPVVEPKPVKEKPSAEEIRPPAGEVQEPGVVVEGRKDKGREDIQQPEEAGVEARRPVVPPEEAVRPAVAPEKQPWEMTLKELVAKSDQKGNWYTGKQYKIKRDKFKEIGLEIGYVKKGSDYYPLNADSTLGTKLSSEQVAKKRKEGLESHKYYVRKALSENKAIPLAVLQEYAGEAWADAELGKREQVKEQAPVEEAKPTPREQAHLDRKKHLRDAFGGETFRAGLDPTLLKDLILEGKYYIEEGFKKFADWSKKMLAEVGIGVKPHLRRVWILAHKPAPKTIKGQIKKTTEVPTEEVITTTRDLLKFAMKKAQTVSRQVYRIAQTDQINTTKELIAYAREHLEGKDLDRVLNVITKARETAKGVQIKRARHAIEVLAGTRQKQKALARYKKAKKPEAKEKAIKLLEGLKDTQSLASTLRRMTSIVRLAEIENDYRIPDALYQRAVKTLGDEGKTLVRDLGAEQIEGLANALEEIVHISNTKNMLLAGRKARTVEQASQDMPAEVIEDHPETRAETDPGKFVPRRRIGALRDLTLHSLWSQELEAFALAGDKGTTYEILYENLREGEDEARRVQEELIDTFYAEIEGLGVDFDTISRWSDPVFRELGLVRRLVRKLRGKGVEVVTVELPRAVVNKTGERVPTREMTVGQRMAIYTHFQDPRTRRELLRNKASGLSFKDVHARSIKLFLEDYLAIIESMTPRQKAVAEAGIVAMRRAREIMEPKWMEEHGYSIFTEETYWPRIRDKEFRTNDPAELMRWFVQRHLDQQSIHKPRTHSDSPIVVTDFFSTLLGHFNKVGAYVGKNQPGKDMARVLGTEDFIDFQNAVRTRVRNGIGVLDNMREYLKGYIGMDKADQTSLDRLVRGMLRRIQTGILGFLPQVSAYQQISWISATNEIEFKYWFQGHSKKHGSNAEVDAALMEVPMFRARREGGAHRIITPGLGGSMLIESFKGRTEGRLAGLGMKPISAMDWVVMRRIYRASVAKGKALGFEGNALKKYAQGEAERIVRLTQPTWDALNQARILRWAAKQPLIKPLVMFSSQTSKNAAMAIRAVLEYQKSEKRAVDFSTMVRKASIPTLLNAILITVIGTGTNRFYKILRELMTGDDEEPRPSESFAPGELAKKSAERLAGNFLITGDIVYDTGEVIVTGEVPYFKESGSILGQAASDLKRGLASTHKAIKGRKKKRRRGTQSDLRRGAESLIDAISLLTGLPLRGPKNIAKKTGLLDVLDE